jgi:DNA-binding beta-propeller fold protein YncE
LAGSGQRKSTNGIGRSASFNAPTDIALDGKTRTLYVLEPRTPSIRIVTTKGLVKTLTKSLDRPTGLAFSPTDESLYTTSAATSDVSRITLRGRVSKFVHVPDDSLPPQILGKASFDLSGNISITEGRAGNIVRITADKSISYNVVGPGVFGICFAVGDFYVVNQVAGTLAKVMERGTKVITSSGLLSFTAQVTYDEDDKSFFIADPHRNRILRADNRGVKVFAGNGTAGEVDGSLADAEFNKPTGIVYDHTTRALYVIDSNGNTVRKVSWL